MRWAWLPMFSAVFLLLFTATSAWTQDDDLDSLFDDINKLGEEPAGNAGSSSGGQDLDALFDGLDDSAPASPSSRRAEDAGLEDLMEDLDSGAPSKPVTPAGGSGLDDLFDGLGESRGDEPVMVAPGGQPGLFPNTGKQPVIAQPDLGDPEPRSMRPEVEVDVQRPQNPEEMSILEEIRRQAELKKGLNDLEEAESKLLDGENEEAVKLFKDALQRIPELDVTLESRANVRKGLAEAYEELARQAYEKARKTEKVYARDVFETAKLNAMMSLEQMPGNKSAQIIRQKAEVEIMKLKGYKPPLAKSPDIVESRKTVRERLDWGKDYFLLGKYDDAERYFESVLVEDPYQVEAMRFLTKIDELRFLISRREFAAVRSGMIRDVVDTWNPPIKAEVELPTVDGKTTGVSFQTDAMRLEKKMKEIVIPSIEFRAVNIQDVVKFLVDASIAGDPEKTGVNIILNLKEHQNSGGASSKPAAAPANDFPDPFGALGDDDPFSGFGGGDDLGGLGGDDGGGDSNEPAGSKITLSLRRVTLLDAIRYITEVANLKYRIENNAVIITPPGVVQGRVVTRIYPVQPSLIESRITRAEFDAGAKDDEFVAIGGRSTEITRSSGDQVRSFFIDMGVPFPTGTSISYNPTIASIIVANTPENLEIFERILSQINVVPNQVEIEARFVEVAQTDLDELGLEWIITDDVELAEKKGLGAASTKPRVVANAEPDGLTKSLRFFSLGTSGIERQAQAVVDDTSFIGDVLKVSGILTNPELSVVLHALNRKGNVDVLSAPRVTTKTGLNAIIEVVEEIIYPSEFETNVQSFDSVVADADGDARNVRSRAVVVTPGQFETREVGVILNVTPTVGPDGYTIELTMSPEVAELVDWVQYGSTFGDQVINIPQPIFSSRNVTTSIVIWDGQTVVMGGLISERLQSMDDRVPLLGDIPLFGRLFRSKGTESQKKNLLIFVTARVVNPAGNPIHKSTDSVNLGGGGAPTAVPLNTSGAGGTP